MATDEPTLIREEVHYLGSTRDGEQFIVPDDEEPGPGIVVSAVEELNELQQGFKDRARAENERFWETVDSEYWVALCFVTREQKEEFLRKMRWMHLGDKYLDGMEAAQTSGIVLESPIPAIRKERIDHAWDDLTLMREE